MQSVFARHALVVAMLLLAACSSKKPTPKIEPLTIDEFSAPSIVEAGKSFDVQWSVSGPLKGLRLLQSATLLTTSTSARDHFTVPSVPAGESVLSLVADGTQDGVTVSSDLKVRGVTQATIVSFTADKTAIAAGTSAVLSWQTVAATKVVISAGATEIAQFVDAEAARGSLVVRPREGTTYTLQAFSVAGTDSKTLPISILDAPVISVATATPMHVNPGEQITLNWKTEHTDTLSIEMSKRVVFKATGDTAVEGSHTFRITQDMTFVLVAEGPGGSATAKVEVIVEQGPRVLSFQALPSMVLADAPFLLEWATSGVDECHLSANGVSIDPSAAGVPVNTSLSQTLQQSTLYRLTCSGEGGEVSKDLAVNVFAVPQILSFTTDKSNIFRRREQATLSWRVTDASTVSIVDGSGTPVDLGNAPVDAGSVVVAPLLTTKYILTASGEGGLVQSVPLLIEVQDPAPDITLSLSKNPIQENQSSELSWQILDGATFSATATGLDGIPHDVDLTGRKMNDLISVSPSETTVYTFAVDGVAGHVEESIQLRVLRAPRFEYARTDTPYLTRGKPFTFSWKALDADTVSMLTPVPPLEGDPSRGYTTIEALPGTQALNPAIGDNTMSTLAFPNGFQFPFFAGTYTNAYVATDGYVCFSLSHCLSTISMPQNQAMPSTVTPNLLIAPFWDDLYTVDTGVLSTGSPRSNFLWRMDGNAPDRTVTIEWRHMEFSNLDLRPADLNFQVVLHENGEFEIWNEPRTAPSPLMHPYGTDLRWGTSASIGVEGPGGLLARTAQPANDPNASALCRTFVPGTTTSPRRDGQCDPISLIRAKTYPAIGSSTWIPDPGSAATVTVSLSAAGPLGTALAPPVVVTLVDAPVATSLTASNTYAGVGESIDLNWVAGPNKAALKSIAIVDSQGQAVYNLNGPQIAALSVLQGRVTIQTTRTTTYTLVVTNLADDVATASADVRVDQPTATFSVDKPVGPAGENYTFSWTTGGAQLLSVIAPNGSPVSGFPLRAPGDRSRMQSGTVVMPISQTGVYTLHTVNGSGTTDIPLTVTVSTELGIFAFRSNLSEQTEQRQVLLSWETFNSTDLKIENISHVPPITVVAAGMMSTLQRRNSATPAIVDDTATTYRLTAYQDDGHGGITSQTRDVTVSSVPAAKATSFIANPTTVAWNTDPVTVSWTTQNAVKINLYEMQSVADGASNGPEIGVVRDQFTGSITTKLTKSTRYRLVLVNRLGDITNVELATPVTVQATGAPGINLTLSPSAAPNGGFVDLSWTASNVEKVYLWRRTPWDAAGSPGSTVDPVQVPYSYRPYDFIDISKSGTPVTLRTGTSSTSTANYDTGFALLDFPTDFAPEYFGEIEGRVLISADGVLLLAPPGTPDTSTLFSCAGSTTVGACSSIASSIDYLSTSTVTPMRNLIAPFWANLSAKNNCAGLSNDPTTCQTGRDPGQVYYQLVGDAPNRMFIVQWEKWDAKSTSYANTTLTFQAKLHENGDIEYQYKTMQSADTTFAKGGNAGTTAGIEHRFQTGTFYRNYYLQLPKTTTTASAKAFINSGDGWRIYSGVQGPSGQLRANFNTPRTFTSPLSVMFRATGYVTGMASPPVASQALNVTAGVDQIIVSELMIDPEPASDEGKQWIELRNITTTAAPLAGYTIQTSNGSYTFQGSESIPANGYFVVAQQNATVPDVGAPIFRLPNSSTGLLLSQPADAVILRYGQVLIDRVEYDQHAGWSLPTGTSLSMDFAAQGATSAPSFLNDSPEFWCSQLPANTFAGTAPRSGATPGGQNVSCHFFDLIPYDSTFEISADPNATIVLNAVDTGHDRTAVADIGFPFNYFGSTYTKINVNDNGFACFGPVTNIPASNSTLPASTSFGGVDALYVFWDDLFRAISGRGVVRTETLGTAPNRTFVAQWDGYTFTSTFGSGELVFMLVLRENGDIEYHYATMASTGTTSQHQGSSATIGLDAFTKTFGVQTTYGNNAGLVTTWTPPMYKLPSPNPFALKAYKAP